ncbi:hypothetical protein HNW13_008330 [Shewanella sp. BF02_Schw]|uniref:DUF6488 family protein n=1 Tax=Shewanella sp. BF02_Schw TaxID=394908 RepID=UPI00177FA6FC|nr:DUF6488 family protein [Shewanella sp. BF02_Schw]MBO1895781.1 hypothetical protein [Shewanella sp. BF02_Schw]
MKALFLLVALFGTAISSYSFAHLDKLKRMDHSRHNHMNDKKAVDIVILLTQKMTFKDLGYKVGQLPASWQNITVADTTVLSDTGDVYIISALNTEINKILYFQIANDGDVIAVSESNVF